MRSGFAVGCEAAALPRRSGPLDMGLCPKIRQKNTEADVNRGLSPEENPSLRGGAKPPPHIRRPSRLDT